MAFSNKLKEPAAAIAQAESLSCLLALNRRLIFFPDRSMWTTSL
jgi:hypothetical protein